MESSKMKPISKITLASIGMVTLALGAISCRDLSVDGGKSSLTCAASSVDTVSGAELKLFDQTHFNTRQIAQAFKPQSTVKNVTSIDLALQRVTSLSMISAGNVIVTIAADNNGIPGSAIGTGAVIPVSKIPTSAPGVKATFSVPIAQLTAKTTYWIVVDGGFSWNTSDYIAWWGTDTGSYADGRALVYSSGTWLNPDALLTDPTNRRSLAFRVGCL
jgi:hypothetical protein